MAADGVANGVTTVWFYSAAHRRRLPVLPPPPAMRPAVGHGGRPTTGGRRVPTRGRP